LSSIKKKKLSDYVIEEIRNMLVSGELKEGDKLPNQNEFSVQLGVSRSSLREALQTLTLMGVIEQRPRLGTVIRSGNVDLWTEKMSPPLVSDAEATLELIKARRYIEIGSAELAARNATDDEIRKIGALIAGMKKALREKRVEDYTGMDVSFHHQLAAASHNRYILHMFITIRKLMEQFIWETFSVMPGLLERSLGFHQNIYAALTKRDGKKAARDMSRHLQDIEASLGKYYSDKKKVT
jgi:GntR family transcriptional repressor for pyruvate dehydrogenase complex